MCDLKIHSLFDVENRISFLTSNVRTGTAPGILILLASANTVHIYDRNEIIFKIPGGFLISFYSYTKMYNTTERRMI